MKKAILYIANRLWLIGLIYVISILLAAHCFSIMENRSYSDGLWWACVTALTIGYGDLSPVTTEGRLMSMTFAHFWIYAIGPMIVANVVIKIMEDKNRFTHQEQEWQENSQKLIAAKLGIELPPAPSDY